MIDISKLLFSLDVRAPLIGVTKTGSVSLGGGLAAFTSTSQTLTLYFDRAGVVTDTYFEISSFPGMWFNVTNLQGGKVAVNTNTGSIPATVIITYTDNGAKIVVTATNITGSGVVIQPVTFSFRAQTLNNVFID